MKELKEEFLIPKGYKPKIIDVQFKRIRDMPGNCFIEKRKGALKKKKKLNSQEIKGLIALSVQPFPT